MRADFAALARIGALPDGGVCRSALGDAHLEARAWFSERAAAAGLEARVDAAGNHSAVLAGPREAPTILLGSHLDTVPVAGCYDGAIGVLAALECLRVVRELGLKLPVTLEAIDFTDEEGSLVGLLGSRALAGSLSEDMLARPRGGREALQAALERAGLREQRLREARRRPERLAAYLELHVEQGPVLAREGVDIGVVTRILGSRSYRVRFEGSRRHAGTTPMHERRDALLGAAHFALAVRETVLSCFSDCVGTVGAIAVDAPAFNVVPGAACALLELRAPDERRLDAVESAILARAHRIAQEMNLAAQVEIVGRFPAVELDLLLRQLIADAATQLGLTCMEISSGAGHDAQALASVTRTGMIFIPSAEGISHDPAEYTEWSACVAGANVLLRTALALARGL